MSARRILIVDDELPNRLVLEAILVPEGFEVEHATDGEQALACIAAGDIDLVLLDVLMPVLGGIETCRRIREELARPFLPVIMVTALSDRGSRTRSKSCGADDFLVKPIHEEELLARVRNLLQRDAYYREAQQGRARAQAEARRWRLVSDVASVVATCRDYEALQLTIGDLLRPHLPIARFAVLERGPDGELCSTAVGQPSQVICDRQWQTLWETRGVVSARSLATELRAVLLSFNRRSSVHGALLPLYVGGHLQGMLVLFTTRDLTEDELSLVAEIGPHLTNAVTNVRSHVKSKELHESRDRLALLLVHDLKNPLSVISMNLEHLAFSYPQVGDQAEALRDSRSAADRLIEMIMDLLDIGRAAEGRLYLKRKRGLVHPIVQTVLSRTAHAAGQRGARLSSDLGLEATIDVDPELLTRVIENVIGNSLRYVPKGGHIDVRSHIDGGELVLQIRNDGPTISPAVRARMFEKYGGDAAHQQGPNRGLGLYFCRLVVEAHGGRIDVSNLAPQGVCFEIRLPNAQLHEERIADLARAQLEW